MADLSITNAHACNIESVPTAENLLATHLDIWTTAIEQKSSAGRGSSKKFSLYGIKKLRELILELAVRGKLVPQDANDEPVSVLLERIAAEKAQLVKEGIHKKPKVLPEIGEDEKPFELPQGWEWCPSISLFTLTKGKKPKVLSESNIGFPYLDIEALDRNNVLRYTNDEMCPKSSSDDIIVVCDGSRSGLVLDGKDGVLGSTLAIINTPPYIQAFIKLFFQQAFLRLNASMKGAAIPHLDTKALRESFIAFPPIEEQHRIVAKVDELMSLCDALEAQTEASIAAHQTLVETLLNALLLPQVTANTASQSDVSLEPQLEGDTQHFEPSLEQPFTNSFVKDWQRVAEHFDTLFTTVASIDTLKQTILQLAVMGKLVKQDPNDEPAAKLLERIAKEKALLIADKKIKKQKPLPAITDEEKPFELPKSWVFAHMQDLCFLITDGTHQTPKYVEDGRPFISAQCVKPFKFIPENCRYVSEEHYQTYIRNRKPEYKDILLARVGAGIGEAALIDSELEFAIYVSTGLLKVHKCSVEPEYLVLWLNSPIGRDFSESNTLGKGISQGNLNLSLIRSFIISLPPLEEQNRIVAKVDELMALCDQLKARLADAQTIQQQLTDAIVEQAIS